MSSDQTHVIVGASLAGAKAAETLREEGFEGRVVLVGTENDGPTSVRRCRRTTCAGRWVARRSTSTTSGFYAEHDIELRLGRTAVSLDTSSREVVLDDGERLRYDRLLLSHGGGAAPSLDPRR